MLGPSSRTHLTWIACLAITPLIAGGCSAPEPDEAAGDAVAVEGAARGGRHPHRPARNVIVMIGDGMSLPQISFLNQHRRLTHPEGAPTAFERMLEGRDHGLLDTYMAMPDGRYTLVADSAASATQIACGVFSLPQVTGLDVQGYPCQTALEYARTLGMATGLVTDARITHATPGAFVAKQVSRSAENEIAVEYITGAAAGKVDVLFGGGARQFVPRGTAVKDALPAACKDLPQFAGSSARADGVDVLAAARDAGYRFVCNQDQLATLAPGEGARVLGTFASAQYPAYPERATVAGLPPLRVTAAKAIELLEADRDGFFLLVEAGLIDYGAHEHDGAYLLRAMQEADQILGDLLAYVDRHPDTLLVVLGDHETASPAFSYRSAAPVTTTLPSGLVHTRTYDFVDAAAAFERIEHQTLSLGGMISPVVARLYRSGYQPTGYPIDQAADELVAAIEADSDYTLTHDQARAVLTVPPGSIVPYDGLADGFYQDSPMQDRLARALTDQTRLLWATGHHSNLPVIVMAAGPHRLARQVRGYHHTTDVGLLLFEALGRE